jgi:hypothetical protein
VRLSLTCVQEPTLPVIIVSDVRHMHCRIRVYKPGVKRLQLSMISGTESAGTLEQENEFETACSDIFIVLQGYMARCKKNAAKETCVRSAALGVFLFRCIFSEKMRVASSCEELAHWAEFEMRSEDRAYDLLAQYMQHKTAKVLWDKAVVRLYSSMNEKVTYMQLNAEFGIDSVIQSRIQLYKQIWKMPHVVRKTK